MAYTLSPPGTKQLSTGSASLQLAGTKGQCGFEHCVHVEYCTAPCCSSCLCLGGCVQLLSRVGLCDPMDCSTPSFPGLHHFPELAQTCVHSVSDAIQPVVPSSCLLSFPASGSFPVSQLFTSGGQSVGASASVMVAFYIYCSSFLA